MVDEGATAVSKAGFELGERGEESRSSSPGSLRGGAAALGRASASAEALLSRDLSFAVCSFPSDIT